MPRSLTRLSLIAILAPAIIALAGCATTGSSSPLRNTYWKLVSLGADPVLPVERQREAHLVLAATETRVSGSGGCNRITGSFELDGDRLSFGRMAGTMMACPSGMDVEQRFLKTLGQVARWRVDGKRLHLLDEAGAELAGFEAVLLR